MKFCSVCGALYDIKDGIYVCEACDNKEKNVDPVVLYINNDKDKYIDGILNCMKYNDILLKELLYCEKCKKKRYMKIIVYNMKKYAYCESCNKMNTK